MVKWNFLAAAIVHLIPLFVDKIFNSRSVMTSIKTSIVIWDSIQIIKYWLLFLFQGDHLGAHI